MKLSTFLDHIKSAAKQMGISDAEMLLRAKEMGYEGIDVTYHAEDDVQSIANLISGAGLAVSSLCVKTAFADKPEDMSVARDAMHWCEVLGTKKYLSIPGMIDLEDETHAGQQKKNIVIGLNRLCEEAEQKGITILMEDYDGAESPYRNLAGLCYFMENVPALRFAYDSGNFDFSDEDELEPFDRLRDRIAHIHLKDRGTKPLADDEQPQISVGGRTIYSSPFGCGYIHSETVMEKVKSIGYDGFLTVEFYRSSRPYEAMQMSAEWILKNLAQ